MDSRTRAVRIYVYVLKVLLLFQTVFFHFEAPARFRGKYNRVGVSTFDDAIVNSCYRGIAYFVDFRG